MTVDFNSLAVFNLVILHPADMWFYLILRCLQVLILMELDIGFSFASVVIFSPFGCPVGGDGVGRGVNKK